MPSTGAGWDLSRLRLRPGKTGQKLQRWQTVTDSTLSGLDADDLLSELLRRTRELLHADTAAVLLLDANGADLVPAATVGFDEAALNPALLLADGFAGRIAASGQPATVDRLTSDPVAFGVLDEQQLDTMVGVPMIVNGRTVGVLQVGSRRSRTFTGDDIELLRLVADRAGNAAQVRLSQLDRNATLALQRSLLPSRPTPIPGLDLAARYVPGAQVGVGGDWYDTFTLPSGHIGLVIGDVAGNGLRAAIVMGRIRSALRAYALAFDDPAEVLHRLDSKIQLFEPGA
jgi:signal transduction protein with GAF and PtsI domain